MIKKLDLEKLWQILNILSNKQDDLCEYDIYVSLLGNQSSYSYSSFEQFLSYYSFKVDGDLIGVFNEDLVPWEDYRVDDFSYIPSVLLSFGEKELSEWMEDEIKRQLEQQGFEKSAEKERIEQEIKQLTKRLNSL